MIARLLFALACMAPVFASAQPAPYTARYEVLRNDKPLGEGMVTLARDGEAWRLSSVTRGTQGLANLAGVEIEETSVFQWRNQRPETLEYRYRQEAAWKTRERRVAVDAAHGRVTSHDKDKVHDFVYSPYVIDRQVVALAMANDLARGKRGKLTYRVVDRDRLGPQTYRVGGEETVDTPAGPQRALRVERVRNRSGRVTTTWLGMENGFVPVRVVQREADGGSFEMRLVELVR